MGLFDFFKKNKSKNEEENLKKGIKKTSNKFKDGLAALFLGKKTIDDDLLEELEELLISADIGPYATDMIIEKVRTEYTRGTLKDVDRIKDALRESLIEILSSVDFNEDENKKPYVILVSGVNGVGKTTSIAKLANMYKELGKIVMVAAADTFRAAATEQLAMWADRLNIPIVRQGDGADPAAVVFDSINSAITNNIDILIIDTAGRLHNKQNLMDELIKINKVINKVLGTSAQESLIVLDATNGQNAVVQAKTFKESINVTGVILTKIDGTAKGGVIVRIVQELNLPIRYIGFGEGMNDLRPFEASSFVEALFEQIDDIKE